MKIKVAPSILSADFSCLGKEIRKVEQAGADMIHVDVMDGHFVPNITIGPFVVKRLRKMTGLPLDVHLMIEKPEKFIDAFVKAGADMITLHIETVSVPALRRQAGRLKKKNIKAGVSLNPSTPLSRIKPVLDAVDFVLVMSVNPGFSGQHFIAAAVPKIRQLRRIFEGDISVDGGINEVTARQAVSAGANILAAGSYVFSFNAKNYTEAIRRLKQCLTCQTG